VGLSLETIGTHFGGIPSGLSANWRMPPLDRLAARSSAGAAERMGGLRLVDAVLLVAWKVVQVAVATGS
jgi:hypothetical protein